MHHDDEIKTSSPEETAGKEGKETVERIVVKLEKPYVFENTEHQEIDLTGLEKLTIQDAIDAQRQLFGEQEVAAAVLCETTTAFAGPWHPRPRSCRWSFSSSCPGA